MCYINSNVSTDLVFIDKSITLNSYQDVIDNNISVFLASKFPEWQKFAEAEENSIQRKIFGNAILYDLNMKWLQKVFRTVEHQSAVVVGRGVQVEAMALGAIFASTVDDEAPNLRALRVIDENARKYTNVIVGNKNTDPVARTVIMSAVTRMLESELVKHVYDIAAEYMISTGMGKVTPSMIAKITKKVEEQKPDMIPISLSNIHNMIRLFVIMIIINIICLVLEVFHYKYCEHR